jgi:hypothetical protein
MIRGSAERGNRSARFQAARSARIDLGETAHFAERDRAARPGENNSGIRMDSQTAHFSPMSKSSAFARFANEFACFG